MEPKVHLSSNGQSVNQDDFNAIAEQAAMNAEWIWAQILRLAPSGGGSFFPVKGVIPSGGQPGSYSLFHQKSLLGSTGSNDAKITIQPFVAVIGSRTDETVAPTGPHDEGTEGTRDALREIRLAAHTGQVGKLFQTELQIPAGHGTVDNNRWDAIYAKVDIDVADGNVTRYQKVGDTAVNPINVSVVNRTKVTIGRVQGSYAANPTKPAIPSDGGGSYYILLGYYFVLYSHTLTSSIQAYWLHEAFAPVLSSPANGGSRCMPANKAFHDSGYAWAVEQWDNTAKLRPRTYLSPNMVGEEKRWIAIDAIDTAGHVSASPNATTVLDDSIDWRKRYFTVIFEAAPVGGGSDGFPHFSGNANLFSSTYSPSTYLRAAQSFFENVSALTSAAATGSLVAFFDSTGTPAIASGAILVVYVRASDGALCVYRNNVDADRRFLIKLEASGKFADTSSAGI